MPGGIAGASPNTNGLSGAQDCNDGPGGGGGGGGLSGGGGGLVDCNIGLDCDNYPAGGGAGGTSLGQTSASGMSITPANSTDPDRGNAGTGGTAATAGQAGFVKISW
jgi:hypothetical protein